MESKEIFGDALVPVGGEEELRLDRFCGIQIPQGWGAASQTCLDSRASQPHSPLRSVFRKLWKGRGGRETSAT